MTGIVIFIMHSQNRLHPIILLSACSVQVPVGYVTCFVSLLLFFYSLYEVDHAGLSVGHLPVEGQRLQAVVAGKGAPRAEVHGAAGLGVAGHGFPPLGSVFVLCGGRDDLTLKGRTS